MKEFKERLNAGIRYDLNRMTRVLELLGHPEKNSSIIHIAGTNGKGSTAAMCEALLLDADMDVFLFQSPSPGPRSHHYRSGGAYASEQAWSAWLTSVMPAVRQTEAEMDEQMTPFELLTAAAFAGAAETKAEVLILEAGMGGRLDATNAAAASAVSVITSVGMDHQAYLGDTREAIAREKAGIFKPGVPAVSTADAEARSWLQEEAEAAGAVWVDLPNVADTCKEDHLLYRDEVWPLPVKGRHQASNALAAVIASEVLSSRIRPEALRLAVMPARGEWLEPDLLVDSAHNTEAVEALIDSLPEGQDTVFLLAAMKDKPAAAMLERMHTKGTAAAVVPAGPRFMQAADWYAVDSSMTMVEDPVSWVSAQKGKTVVVTGSHAFTSTFREEWKNRGMTKAGS
ncbi:bifunctional folylpolyglutamate synthase/dihydrofolate synthase [Alkalicoccus chagannorensis]|uniref:bifunctional folylpolyglutamate synthase/dihydrofolate synthase n=1 Tax=Alkalicoccus chagannorensis TaxID=427072 RepID=UPI000421BDAC|nr:Mur ligase family protein [Alkalicoccus chagannorensis]